MLTETEYKKSLFIDAMVFVVIFLFGIFLMQDQENPGSHGKAENQFAAFTCLDHAIIKYEETLVFRFLSPVLFQKLFSTPFHPDKVAYESYFVNRIIIVRKTLCDHFSPPLFQVRYQQYFSSLKDELPDVG